MAWLQAQLLYLPSLCCHICKIKVMVFMTPELTSRARILWCRSWLTASCPGGAPPAQRTLASPLTGCSISWPFCSISVKRNSSFSSPSSQSYRSTRHFMAIPRRGWKVCFTLLPHPMSFLLLLRVLVKSLPWELWRSWKPILLCLRKKNLSHWGSQ